MIMNKNRTRKYIAFGGVDPELIPVLNEDQVRVMRERILAIVERFCKRVKTEISLALNNRGYNVRWRKAGMFGYKGKLDDGHAISIEPIRESKINMYSESAVTLFSKDKNDELEQIVKEVAEKNHMKFYVVPTSKVNCTYGCPKELKEKDKQCV